MLKREEPGEGRASEWQGGSGGRHEMKLRKHKMEKICRALWSRRLLLFILEEREHTEGVTQQDCLQRISGAKRRTDRVWGMGGVV